MKEPFMSLIIPAIYCSFPPAINPEADAVQAQVTAWAKHFQLIQSPQALERFTASKFGYLTARAFPRAPFTPLTIVADWNVWLFLLDDHSDESGFGRDPARMQAVLGGLLGILYDESPAAHEGPLASALRDLWDRLRAHSTPVWQARFIRTVEDYFTSCVAEATNRAAERIPSVEDYIALRRQTGALLTNIDMIDLTERIGLPEEIRTGPIVTELTAQANDIVCWTNDIVSLRKEMARGDVHNLVLVLRHEHGDSLQDAVNVAARMVRERTEAFEELERARPRWDAAIETDLEKYEAVLRAWIRGNFDWGRDSGRYTLVVEGPDPVLDPLLDADADADPVAAGDRPWWQRWFSGRRG